MKITDKDRIDYLTENVYDGYLQAQGRFYLRTFGLVKKGRTVRRVIDAAIRASKKRKA